jgi:hypothetical protein
VAEPGAVGVPGYSSLIELPDGTVLNAPHVAAATGRADKAVAIETAAGTVRHERTFGFACGQRVRYVSTDASDPAVAALEARRTRQGRRRSRVETALTRPEPRWSHSSTARPVRATERQGLSSALLDGLHPLTVLAWTPNQGRYSPLWDVHPAQWSAAAVASGANVAQTSVDAVEDLVERGTITGPGGAPFGPADVVVDCPIVISLG